MQLRTLIERKLRRSLAGVDVESDVHAIVAANVLSDNSVAYANAVQDVDIDQSN